jgi:hypothetical protein
LTPEWFAIDDKENEDRRVDDSQDQLKIWHLVQNHNEGLLDDDF